MMSTRAISCRVALVSICAAAASAGGQISDPYITFEVSNANGSGSFTVNLADTFALPGGVIYQSFAFGPMFPLDITDGGGAVIATLVSANAPTIADDPGTTGVDALSILNFVLSAGDLDTDVRVTSSFVTLPGSVGPNPTVRANAGYTASDEDGDGVQVSGGSALTSFYVNGDANTGSLFAGLNSGFSGGSFASPHISDSTGDVLLGSTVSSFQFRSEFSISADDEVSGNFSFRVVPAPASASLIAIGGIAAIRRRR